MHSQTLSLSLSLTHTHTQTHTHTHTWDARMFQFSFLVHLMKAVVTAK
jgi:hypothetical protein